MPRSYSGSADAAHSRPLLVGVSSGINSSSRSGGALMSVKLTALGDPDQNPQPPDRQLVYKAITV